ncbi:antiholin LrgA [Vagococcus penaei]|uniref:Antiholin LrgA n=1 Tax=Vagococcus penaei TaxID=633807 RepID=A0A1Q2D893_9ENTE|nr:antiholin-like murein hydrolase modulator LrgA [Vagococcus penaei]AQP54619.1 antiholin LrgA [Vagococcus penaei]RSU06668.1 antiholin LrgA [Vagococcus penaei]
METPTQHTQVKVKATPFLQQAFIFSLIILISNGLSFILPIPMPASVIGLILLFIALCTNIVKLEQVEGLSNNLSTIISFLFVPSGISLINSLDLMKTSGSQILLIIFVATFVLLALTGWSASYLLKARRATIAKKAPTKKSAVFATKSVQMKEVR